MGQGLGKILLELLDRERFYSALFKLSKKNLSEHKLWICRDIQFIFYISLPLEGGLKTIKFLSIHRLASFLHAEGRRGEWFPNKMEN